MLCRDALHTGPPMIKIQPDADAEQPRWYAVYTWARHEKAVANQFEQRGLKHFLPLYLTVRYSNRRTVRLSLPLFPSYVFVQTVAADHFRPLQVPGVVHYVGNHRASPIPSDEIEGLRRVLLSGVGVQPHPYLAPGNAVRISSGPLAGLSGVIERTKSGSRFIVSVNMIMRSIAVEVNGLHLTADPPLASAGLSVA
jgi:transcription termination/antitermination protein NusG